MITVVIVYVLGTLVIVGVVPPQKLFGSLTPVADAAHILAGSWGVKITAMAALLAFLSIANAGIMSASRYPLAMSRDHLLPRYFTSFNKSGIPDRGIYITIAMVLVVIFLFDPLKIAKLASAFQLLMFSLICLAVIVMRESRIESYDPGYRSPLYPWMQIFGIFAPFVLIFEIGMISLLFTFGLVLLSSVWYFFYAHDKVERVGAMYHIFERMGQRRFGGLDRELRGILVEKGLRGSDPFDEVITRAQVIMLSKKTTFEQAVLRASDLLSQHLPYTAAQLTKRFLEDTKLGITPVTHGLALPHLRLPNVKRPEMVLLQCRPGIIIDKNMQIPDTGYSSGPIHAVFFLVSPLENPGQHLRILASIAGHADDDRFIPDWLSATNENKLKKLFLKDKHFLTIHIKEDSQSASFISQAIGDLELPENCLIAFILRINKTIIPRGNTVLEEKDLITFIGEPHAIEQVYNQYGGRKQKKIEDSA
jgi:mannitol/fructose-specific phosphotransferase system IIA component (Ntr-type)